MDMDTSQKTVTLLCRLARGLLTSLTTYAIIITVRTESTDESHKSTIKCSKQTPDSDVARSFWLWHTIWEIITKMKEITAAAAAYICRTGSVKCNRK